MLLLLLLLLTLALVLVRRHSDEDRHCLQGRSLRFFASLHWYSRAVLNIPRGGRICCGDITVACIAIITVITMMAVLRSCVRRRLTCDARIRLRRCRPIRQRDDRSGAIGCARWTAADIRIGV